MVTVQPWPTKRANHACMNEHVVRDMSGAPEYEQKELRSNEVHVSAILRMARAELLQNTTNSSAFHAVSLNQSLFNSIFTARSASFSKRAVYAFHFKV